MLYHDNYNGEEILNTDVSIEKEEKENTYKITLIQKGPDNALFKRIRILDEEDEDEDSDFSPPLLPEHLVVAIDISESRDKETKIYRRVDVVTIRMEGDKYAEWFEIVNNPNMLDKPRSLSAKMCGFLGYETDYKLSRVDVNKGVLAYIYFDPSKTNYLKIDQMMGIKTPSEWGNQMNPEGKRNLRGEKAGTIEPDEKLSKLLGYEEYVQSKGGNVKFHYGILQFLIAKHFK